MFLARKFKHDFKIFMARSVLVLDFFSPFYYPICCDQFPLYTAVLMTGTPHSVRPQSTLDQVLVRSSDFETFLPVATYLKLHKTDNETILRHSKTTYVYAQVRKPSVDCSNNDSSVSRPVH